MGSIIEKISPPDDPSDPDGLGVITNPSLYKSVDEVSEALKKAGLESSNLIIGIDFTKSNLDHGRKTFGGKSLHHLEEDDWNPYQRVIHVVGNTLEKFDDDNWIPCFGFGDITTKGDKVFAFTPDPLNNRFCRGFKEVLEVYTKITPHIRLSGPTNFAPLIFKAMEIVKSSRTTEYHILVIIADGQVTIEAETMDAIRKCSYLPISIIMVGVGDGPWDTMHDFDDRIKGRKFDNFQFVDYDKVIREARKKKIDTNSHFANEALMEIPLQYTAIKKLGLLNMRNKSNLDVATTYNFRSKWLKPMPTGGNYRTNPPPNPIDRVQYNI